MPEYLSPGVYVEEVDTGSKPIEGVSTSTSAVVGVCERGPVNVPILVTSNGEYMRHFGGELNRTFYPAPHNHLPHAVQGFFTNGGQRLYVVRALDTQAAQHAHTRLFDRGTGAQTAETRLLRAAPVGSGTLASGLPIFVVDSTGLLAGEWFRVGEGSRAEYRRAATVDASIDHISLDLPLSRTHADTVQVDELTRLTVSPQVELTETAAAGAVEITITGPVADVTAYMTALGGGPILLEIGALGNGEYRYATGGQANVAGDEATLDFDAPLAFEHGVDVGLAVQVLVNHLDDTNLAVSPHDLATVANAGDSMIFVEDGTGAPGLGNLLMIDPGSANQEVRRIGSFGSLELASGSYEAYPSNSLVERLVLADAGDGTARAVVAANEGNPGDFDFEVDVASDIAVLFAGVGPEDVEADGIAGATVTTVAPLGALHAATASVERLSAFTLTAAAAAGDRSIDLSGRIDILDTVNPSLKEGQILRIGEAPNDEYIEVADLSAPDPTQPPDPGTVSLTALLRNAHAEGTFVYVQEALNAGSVSEANAIALPSAEGDDELWVSESDGFATGEIIRITTPRRATFYHRLSAPFAAAADVSQVVIDNPPLSRAHPMGSLVAERQGLFDVQALDAGLWGNRLRISSQDEEGGLVENTRLRQVNVTNPTTLRLDSALGVEPGTVLEFSDAVGAVVGGHQKVEAIDRRTGVIELAAPGLDAAQTTALGAGDLVARSREFRLRVSLLRQPDPAVPSRNDTVIDTEEFRFVSMDSRHSQYFERVIGPIEVPDEGVRLWDQRTPGQSLYIRVGDLDDEATQQLTRLGPEELIDVLPSGREEPALRQLIDGFDALAMLDDNTHIVGVDAPEPEDRTGIQSLRNQEDVSLVATPGRDGEDVQRGLIEHCEAMRYRFAVLDGPAPNDDTLTDVQALRQRYDTKYAAVYHPWLLISDPFPRDLQEIDPFSIPPSGHMLGVYARTDVERGVHKAPANEVVRGIRGLQRQINKREHDILNPKNINVIRDFRKNNRGIRSWGGRVITSDADFKYVNVRRLLIFIEHSIERGTQWVVFEPNAEPLWARVARSIRNFLTVVWRDGALEGTTTEEAFFVKCDRTTMTQTDIDNGRLICEIGVAPVKPAEFVIFRIGLWTAHADD